jgi:hypothetical protein
MTGEKMVENAPREQNIKRGVSFVANKYRTTGRTTKKRKTEK